MRPTSPNEASKYSYLGFVRREFPEKENSVNLAYDQISYLKKLVQDDMDSSVHTKFLNDVIVVDLQPEPHVVRLFPDRSKYGPVDQEFGATQMQHMSKLICEAQASDRKILIAWRNYQFDVNLHETRIERIVTLMVLMAVAEATFMNPNELFPLMDWIQDRIFTVGSQFCGDEEFVYILKRLYEHDAFLTKLGLVYWRGKNGMLQSTRGTNVPVIEFPCISIDIAELFGGQPARNHVPIYILSKIESIPDKLTGGFHKWILSHASPEAVILTSGALDIKFMACALYRALRLTARNRMSCDVFALIYYLRLRIGVFKKALDNWKDRVDTERLSKTLSEIDRDLKTFEPDIRDVYQIFVDRQTLKETRRSIEMSEKSIKESERVRILTIIALIFLPVSLASSIFGMNVTLINAKKTPFYAFIITSIALCAGSLLIWFGCSILLRYQKLRRLAHWKRSPAILIRLALISWLNREDPSERVLTWDTWSLRGEKLPDETWMPDPASGIQF